MKKNAVLITLSFFILSSILGLLLFRTSFLEDPYAPLELKPTAFKQLPGWQNDNLADALTGIQLNCKRILRLASDTELHPGWQAGDWHQPCQQIVDKDLSAKQLQEVLQQWFQPYQVKHNRKKAGLFTGYYTPVLKGSEIPDDRYLHPVYNKPDELLVVEDLGIFRPDPLFKGKRIAGKIVNGTLKPYYTREEINQGALSDRVLEIAWVKDPVKLFFMHVQGSGIIETDKGHHIQLAYNGTNGHEYLSIGRVLIEQGEIPREQISMQSIQAWLNAHPSAADDLLNQNKSYVFFRKNHKVEIKGAAGIPLTAERSLAVDPAFIPFGSLLWLNCEHPLDQQRIQKLVFAQDAGGAIRGGIRGDLYWGIGDQAGQLAGKMKSTGEYYLLLPKKSA